MPQHTTHISFFLVLSLLFFLSACSDQKKEQTNTPDSVSNAVLQDLKENKPQALWKALPPSYQQDINTLIHDFANKMDVELYNKIAALSTKLVILLRDQKNFILNSPMMSQPQAQANKADIEKNWDAVVSLFATLTQSDLTDIDKVKTLDIEKFLTTTGSQFMTQFHRLQQSLPENNTGYSKQFLNDIEKIELVSSEGNNAVIKTIYKNGQSRNENMTKIEEHWIPSNLAENWKMEIDKAKQEIAKISPEQMAKNKVQTMMLIGSIDAMMTQLGNATTQQEFDAAFMGFMMGMMNVGAKANPSTPPSPPQPSTPSSTTTPTTNTATP